MKKTIHHSTARALNDRAVEVANSLEFWVDWVHEQMKAQNIEPYLKQDLSNLTGDSFEPITFKRKDIRNLVVHMKQNISRLRNFSNPSAGYQK
jgi:hypothetical protein